MVATPSEVQEEVQECHRFGEQVETRMQEIERLADAGDWDKIETVLHRLPDLIARIPDAERRDILLSTQNRVERIHDRASVKSEEIAEQLATLKTGQRAVASYQATEGLAVDLLQS